MDVARISFAFIIAVLHAAAALAGGPADWMSAGPPSVSTPSSTSERYSYPQGGQPATASQQVQSWSNSASQQLQAAGNNLRSGAQQTVGK